MEKSNHIFTPKTGIAKFKKINSCLHVWFPA